MLQYVYGTMLNILELSKAASLIPYLRNIVEMSDGK